MQTQKPTSEHLHCLLKFPSILKTKSAKYIAGFILQSHATPSDICGFVETQIGCVFVSISIALMTHHDHTQLMEESIHLILYFTLLKQGWNLEAGTAAETMEWRYFLACFLWLAWFAFL